MLERSEKGGFGLEGETRVQVGGLDPGLGGRKGEEEEEERDGEERECEEENWGSGS